MFKKIRAGATAPEPGRSRVLAACVLTLVATALTLAFAGAAAQARGSADAGVGLVAAYSFDEGAGSTVADTSGYANAGTISGAKWTAAGRRPG
jgi:hypothetical protein